ncbi:MAG: carbon starvation CstA 5TM domain-containing protein [Rhodohalobacter sp.]|nr:carbon starvation CstA 5TM domain-containing protein [Rhodohalobacter sp.]MDZ7758264.1 carbon starvation CstA 5TM domain-containing protein [Rhodohalobacter sp.]
MLITIWLKRQGRPIIYTLVPMIFVLFMTLWAMIEQVIFDWSGAGNLTSICFYFRLEQ